MRIVPQTFFRLIGLFLLSTSAIAIADDEYNVKQFQNEISVASEKVVTRLSQQNAFANDEQIKVQLPAAYKLMLDTNKQLEKELIVDVEDKLNIAAEQAAVGLKPVVNKLLLGMSSDDARQLVEGTGDAATEFLSKHIGDIKLQMLEPVSDALRESGTEQAYAELRGQDLLSSESSEAMEFINNQVETYRERTLIKRAELDSLIKEKSSHGVTAYKEKLASTEREYETNKALYETVLASQKRAQTTFSTLHENDPQLPDLLMEAMLSAYFHYLAIDGYRI